MPWILKVSDSFGSAHFLRNYRGKCENLHGHNWRVEVEVMGNEIDEAGMLVDFKVLKSALKRVIEPLDHRLLNEVPPFDVENPSSENLARYIFRRLQKELSVRVYRVTVWESENACATYFEE